MIRRASIPDLLRRFKGQRLPIRREIRQAGPSAPPGQESRCEDSNGTARRESSPLQLAMVGKAFCEASLIARVFGGGFAAPNGRPEAALRCWLLFGNGGPGHAKQFPCLIDTLNGEQHDRPTRADCLTEFVGDRAGSGEAWADDHLCLSRCKKVHKVLG